MSTDNVTPPEDHDESWKEKNDRWPFTTKDDGWIKAHDALRADLSDLRAVIQAMQQLAKNNRLTKRQIKSVLVYWARFQHSLTHHHDTEDHIVIPWMCTRVLVPDTVASEHKELLDAMEAVDTKIKAVDMTESSIAALYEKFQILERVVLDHFQEEEASVLKLLRLHFTFAEFIPVEKQILKHLGPADLGWILRAMKNDEERRYWMTNVAKIPRLVQSLLMLPFCRRHLRKYIRPLQDIVKEAEGVAN